MELLAVQVEGLVLKLGHPLIDKIETPAESFAQSPVHERLFRRFALLATGKKECWYTVREIFMPVKEIAMHLMPAAKAVHEF